MQPFRAADVLSKNGPLVDDTWLAAGIPMLTGSGRKGQLFQALQRASDADRLPNPWDPILAPPTKPAYQRDTASRRLHNFLTYSGGGL